MNKQFHVPITQFNYTKSISFFGKFLVFKSEFTIFIDLKICVKHLSYWENGQNRKYIYADSVILYLYTETLDWDI